MIKKAYILLAWFYLSSLSLFAASGDILSVTVRDDGWTADITLEGRSDSGTYDFGWCSSIKGDISSGTFQAGETVTQTGTGATAIAWGAADSSAVATNDALWVYTVGITGSPNATGVWTGGTSGATFTPTQKPMTKSLPTRATPKIVFTVASYGYDDSGNLGTVTRTVYGTKQVRKPWPNEATNEELESGANVTVRIALSDLIYLKEDTDYVGTAPTVTIAAGFYNGGGANNSTTDLVVTNNSTVAYLPVIMNWSWPGYDLMDANTELRALAYHYHGTQGRPVRCIKFSVSDGTFTNTEIVTNMNRSHDWGDLVKVIEYISSTDLTSGLTQGAELTCNITAYPWVGDNALSSSTGAAPPSPLVGPIKMVCDRLGTYGQAYAVVDPVSGTDPAVGSDSGKWVGNGTAHGDGTGVTPYQSIARAARAIRDYNNANRVPARDDVGGGVIYLKAGNYNWLGNSITGTYGSTPKVWVTIKPYTGVTRDEVVITGNSGNTDISDRVKLEWVKINTTTSSTFSGCLAMWLDYCDLNSSAAATWNSAGQVIWLTRGKVGTFTQGLKPNASNVNMSFALIRGMDLTSFSGTCHLRTFIGNKRSVAAAGGVTFQDHQAGQISPVSIPIMAYNELYGYDVSSGTAVLRVGYINNVSNILGTAIVQNLLEVYTGDAGGIGNIVSSDGLTTFNSPYENVLIWHNTFVGERMQIAYNSEGTWSKVRRYWSLRNNYFDNLGYKTDTFEGSSEGPNGNRIGSWNFGFGVGHYDNANFDIPAISADAFDLDFSGLNANDPQNSLVTDPQFVDRKTKLTEGTSGTGVGNYRVLAGSPLNDKKFDYTIPFDLDGEARDLTNATNGVYVYGEASSSGNDPVVTITAPVNGHTAVNPITFTGTATDTEDGTITSSISWSSNIDGVIGTGASISPTLTVGTHIITASITDSNLNVDSTSITVNVSATPSAVNATGNTATGPITIQ